MRYNGLSRKANSRRRIFDEKNSMLYRTQSIVRKSKTAFYSTLNRVWKESYLQSFAIIFLHAQDSAGQWMRRLHETKYYHCIQEWN